jgi:hypothetical protein
VLVSDEAGDAPLRIDPLGLELAGVAAKFHAPNLESVLLAKLAQTARGKEVEVPRNVQPRPRQSRQAQSFRFVVGCFEQEGSARSNELSRLLE